MWAVVGTAKLAKDLIVVGEGWHATHVVYSNLNKNKKKENEVKQKGGARGWTLGVAEVLSAGYLSTNTIRMSI